MTLSSPMLEMPGCHANAKATAAKTASAAARAAACREDPVQRSGGTGPTRTNVNDYRVILMA